MAATSRTGRGRRRLLAVALAGTPLVVPAWAALSNQHTYEGNTVVGATRPSSAPLPAAVRPLVPAAPVAPAPPAPPAAQVPVAPAPAPAPPPPPVVVPLPEVPVLVAPPVEPAPLAELPVDVELLPVDIAELPVPGLLP